jgi:cyclic di-GMP phosphodiesterase Gmr
MNEPLPPIAIEELESGEALRESWLTLRQQHEALRRSHEQAQHLLDALESLLQLDVEDDPFARVFASLRLVFTYSQAMLLGEPDGGADDWLQCIVAEPASLQGARWPVADLFRKVLNGRIVTTFASHEIAEWRVAASLDLSPTQSALYIPLRVRTRRGILVLLRPAHGEPFDRGHVALAKRFSVLVSYALATRYAHQSAVESERLRELTAQLRQSEQAARRNAELLEETVNVLPLGVAVQDDAGRLLVVNLAAANALGLSVAQARDASLFKMLGGDVKDFERRRAAFREHMDSGEQRSRERSVTIAGREYTMLVTGKPVRIFDERLLLTAMLDISERKRFERELAHQAFHDQLTQLPNRTLMREIVDAALHSHQRGGMFALAFIDLDNFKQVNDYYSHAIGDALLCAVAERIARTIRPGDTIARISGDEFLLLINPLENEQSLVPLINRLLEALKQPFEIEGHRVLTSASVGASIFPLHGATYEALQRSADNAMYRAKNERKGSARYFDLSMGHALTARMALEQQLRAALQAGRFRAAFQPKVDLADGRVLGFEALVRWVEPDGQVRLPGSFIGLANELGLIDDITGFVLDDVREHLPALVQRFGPGLSVNLNIASRQAGDLAFMARLAERLSSDGLASHVVIELTEEALVATQRFQNNVLPRLRGLGVRVAIDDFGTGYSSLSMLADLTADEVKVDRAFITAIQDRPRSQGILKAIESLCNALQIDLIAEGVETAQERDYLLTRSSIRHAQGFLYAPPLFIDAALALPQQLAPLERIAT